MDQMTTLRKVIENGLKGLRKKHMLQLTIGHRVRPQGCIKRLPVL